MAAIFPRFRLIFRWNLTTRRCARFVRFHNLTFKILIVLRFVHPTLVAVNLACSVLIFRMEYPVFGLVFVKKVVVLLLQIIYVETVLVPFHFYSQYKGGQETLQQCLC